MEERLCRNADIVFPSTDSMLQRFKHLNPEMHVVPHGADYPHFAKATHQDTPIPEDIASLPRPVIGSIGVMDPERFDADLIAALATARPHWSLVLVGPARKEMDLTRFESLPNVYLTGNRPIADLPNYLKGMDVTLIPYKINEATRDIYPLKLQEYLAAGRPVVSSAMPAVLPYAPLVRIARHRDEFLQEIEAALQEDSEAHRARRQAVARENSWEARVASKVEHLDRLLNQPPSGALSA
jgi:glycosyltransferase involved in cell wall biosynthesis